MAGQEDGEDDLGDGGGGQYEVQADAEQLWIVLSPFKNSSQ